MNNMQRLPVSCPSIHRLSLWMVVNIGSPDADCTEGFTYLTIVNLHSPVEPLGNNVEHGDGIEGSYLSNIPESGFILPPYHDKPSFAKT